MRQGTAELVAGFILGCVFSAGITATMSRYHEPSAPSIFQEIHVCQLKVDKNLVLGKDLWKWLGLPYKLKHPSYNAWMSYYDHEVMQCILER
jgi:hypothetical protein